MFIINENKKLKIYKYKGKVRDCSLVRYDMVKELGRKKADVLMWALEQFNYFVIPSNQLNKGKYILVDGWTLIYTDEDFYRTIEDLRDDTVNAIKYYISQKHVDENRGLEMIEGII